LKRAFDIIGSGLIIIVLLPVFAAVAILALCLLGRPVFFFQERIGLHGRSFLIYKFRTMMDLRDSNGNLLPDGLRTTRFGLFLRRLSLDELPQLFNVLKGDMSLVGPRPLISRYVPYYTPREMTRHDVRPGITGLAQISGRNLLPWQERLELDAHYAETHSLPLDLVILLKTVWFVVKREGFDVGNVVESAMDEERKSYRHG